MRVPLPKQLKHQIRTIAWDSKALFLKEKQRAGDSMILVYHGIVPKHHLKFNLRFTTIDRFTKQMKRFKNKFNMVTVEDIFEGRTESTAFNVAITFDDGYLNNYKYAAPILDQLNLPATIYITTIRQAGFDFLWADFLDVISPAAPKHLRVDGMDFNKHNNEFISNRKSLKQMCKLSDWDFKLKMFEALKPFDAAMQKKENLDYWELMNATEIAGLGANKLFTIGSHGVYHNNLESVSLTEAATELAESKKYLEQILQKPITQFAYPDGSYNAALIELVEQCGYKYQLLASSKFEWSDKRTKERLVINPFLHAGGLMKYIQKGSYT